MLPVNKLYWTWNEIRSGQLANRSPGISPVSMFDEIPNSCIFFIPASDGDKAPESLFPERSSNLSSLRLPSSRGTVPTSPALLISRCCSMQSLPRAEGSHPPRGFEPSTSDLSCNIEPKNSGTPPLMLLKPICRSWSAILASDTGMGPVNALPVRLRCFRLFGNASGIGPVNALPERSR
ncbi:hypothetical protein SORBI_3004G048201 [Sorghum bicolor]|uniref:Uncharacterized protein n=1 Tax=Sorghum bicolor TaxID=4558 RepID=A0A1Z5RM19_SORBI|nr:hypothetical protein SORBI_3004G048201 [Sorghum bicolor]